MENIEENVVTKGAAAAEAMPSSGASVEDLGGPTPENYRPDDDSAKLKDPAATLAQVKDVVNAKAAKKLKQYLTKSKRDKRLFLKMKLLQKKLLPRKKPLKKK